MNWNPCAWHWSVIAIVWALSYLIVPFLIRGTWMLLRRSSGKKATDEKSAPAPTISDEHLAEIEFGILEPGTRVFAFEIESGKQYNVYTDRFRSSRELDPEVYKQVKALSGIHAIAKFNKWKEAQSS